jgi:histone-lysine N-methyltransferase SETDB1
MVRMNVSQIIRTEWEGKWWLTRVLEVDASLVKLQFQMKDSRKELVYRKGGGERRKI